MKHIGCLVQDLTSFLMACGYQGCVLRTSIRENFAYFQFEYVDSPSVQIHGNVKMWLIIFFMVLPCK